jgi:hypothetical protein
MAVEVAQVAANRPGDVLLQHGRAQHRRLSRFRAARRFLADRHVRIRVGRGDKVLPGRSV